MASLYEQIGGEPAMDAAIELFYRKVLSDPVVNHFFEKIDMNYQANQQKNFLTYALGGPNNYVGRDMREAHKHLALKEEHFAAIAKHLQETLTELHVPDDLIKQVMDVVASTHDEVLNL